MSKFQVYQDTEGWVEFEVEADNKEEARSKVQDYITSKEVEGVEEVNDSTGYETVGIEVHEK